MRPIYFFAGIALTIGFVSGTSAAGFTLSIPTPPRPTLPTSFSRPPTIPIPTFTTPTTTPTSTPTRSSSSSAGTEEESTDAASNFTNNGGGSQRIYSIRPTNCGNGACDANETSSCPQDCYNLPPTCDQLLLTLTAQFEHSRNNCRSDDDCAAFVSACRKSEFITCGLAIRRGSVDTLTKAVEEFDTACPAAEICFECTPGTVRCIDGLCTML